MRAKRIGRKSTSGVSEGPWREAVLTRDGRRCRLSHRDPCSGPLAAHHVIFKSRDGSRRLDVDNGATLCRKHHTWVHANSREARDRYGLAGHATDTVLNGRVVMEQITTAGLPVVSPFAEELAALRAARPRRLDGP